MEELSGLKWVLNQDIEQQFVFIEIPTIEEDMFYVQLLLVGNEYSN
ncbi:hypothetical protein H6A66_16995 [Bacteroides caecigallinarum]|nr:hypothetical protein [Bacteroides caecigallinarum]MBM6866832.1 hypothetical protein [Bacteroides caecigallinarum]